LGNLDAVFRENPNAVS